MDEHDREPPYIGGAQPVNEHPTPVPTGGGRGAMQTVVVVIAVLVVIAAVMWLARL